MSLTTWFGASVPATFFALRLFGAFGSWPKCRPDGNMGDLAAGGKINMGRYGGISRISQ